MSVATKRLNEHRSAGVGSGRAPRGRRTAGAPGFVHKKLPAAVPIFRDRTRMSELQRVPSLIGDIYESILDRSVWNGVFDDLVEFVGAQAGALLWKSYSRSTDVVHISGIK